MQKTLFLVGFNVYTFFLWGGGEEKSYLRRQESDAEGEVVGGGGHGEEVGGFQSLEVGG